MSRDYEKKSCVLSYLKDQKRTRYMIAELKDDLFLDKATRGIMFIVTIFNGVYLLPKEFAFGFN